MGIVLVVLAILVALAILGYILTIVSDADHKAGKTLRAEKHRLGIPVEGSLADHTYDETPEEKRVRLGAPALV